ncbi:MAG: WD40/YVTN/BNR-like repeat-containing protein [Chthoniobacterales bacterium]
MSPSNISSESRSAARGCPSVVPGRVRVVSVACLAVIFWPPVLHAEDFQASKEKIVSAIRRENSMLASTPTGFFRASLADKIWRELDVPPAMTPGGIFIQQDAKSPLLAYYQPYRVNYPAKLGKVTESFADLFVSRDDGKTWAQTSEGRRLGNIHIHTDGIFYALEEPKLGSEGFNGAGGAVLRSTDDGKTWTNVTSNLPESFAPTNFVRDPLHPASLLVVGNWGLGHFGIFRAGADGRWERTDEGSLSAMAWRRHALESGWQSGSSASYQTMLEPRLSNYFSQPLQNWEPDDPFRFQPRVHALRLEMEKTAFTFRKGAPMIVPVKVIFESDDQIAKLLDCKHAAEFWRVGTVSYGKEPGLDLQNLDATEKNPPPHTGFDGSPTTVKVDSAHPYARDINLADLHDFSKPGIYRVLLYHTDKWKAAWGGTLGSPVLDITITE